MPSHPGPDPGSRARALLTLLLPNCCSARGIVVVAPTQSLPLPQRSGLASLATGAHAPDRGETNDPQVRVAAFGRPGRFGDSGIRPDGRFEHRHRQADRPADARRDRRRGGAGSGAASSSRSTPATSSSPRLAATRRCPTCRWRSARSPRRRFAISGATDIRQLNQVAPSLLVSSTSSEAGAAVARIRGIGTVGDNPGLESSVGVFIDGVYRSRTGIGLTELGPLDRIEVLRGPAGHVVRPQYVGGPHLDHHRQAALHAGGQRPGRRRQLRLSRASKRASPGRSATPSRRASTASGSSATASSRTSISGRDVNDRDRWMLRGQVLFQPSDDFSFRLIGDYSKRNEECCARAVPAGARRGRRRAAAASPTSPRPSRASSARSARDHRGRSRSSGNVSITPGRSYRQPTSRTGGISGEAGLRFRLGRADLDHRLPLQQIHRAARTPTSTISTSSTATTTAARSTASRPSPRSCGCRAMPAATASTGWSAAITRTRSCGSPTTSPTAPITPLTPTAWSRTNFACLTGQRRPACSRRARRPASTRRSPARILPAFGRRAGASLLRRRSALGLGLVFARRRRSPTAASPTSRSFACGAPGLSRRSTARRSTTSTTRRSNNFAVFTHNIFSITDRLKLTLGARYTHEKKTLDADLTDNNGALHLLRGVAVRGAAAAAVRHPERAGREPRHRRQLQREQALGNRGAELQADRPAADLRELFARLQGGRLQPRPLGAVPAIPRWSQPPRCRAAARSAFGAQPGCQASSPRARTCSSSRKPTTRSKSAPSTTAAGSTSTSRCSTSCSGTSS